MTDEKEKILSEIEAAQVAGIPADKKILLQKFFADKELSDYIKEQFLAGVMQHDSMERMVGFPGANWIFTYDLNMPNEQYAEAVKRNVHSLKKFEAIWRKLEAGGKQEKAKSPKVNEAR